MLDAIKESIKSCKIAPQGDGRVPKRWKNTKKKKKRFFVFVFLHLGVLILGAFYIFVVSALYGLIPNALNVHFHISRPLFNKPSFYLSINVFGQKSTNATL